MEKEIREIFGSSYAVKDWSDLLLEVAFCAIEFGNVSSGECDSRIIKAGVFDLLVDLKRVARKMRAEELAQTEDLKPHEAAPIQEKDQSEASQKEGEAL